MEQIRLGLEQGIDAELYARHNIDYTQMKRIRMALEEGNFNEEQLYEIEQGIDSNVDVTVYAKPEFEADQMEQIRMGMEDKSDVSIYAKPEFDPEQMDRVKLLLGIY